MYLIFLFCDRTKYMIELMTNLTSKSIVAKQLYTATAAGAT